MPDVEHARPRYRGERVQLVQRLPRHVHRVLVAGDGPPLEAIVLQRSGFEHVAVLTPTARPGAALLQEAFVGDPATAQPPPGHLPFDAVIWLTVPAQPGAVTGALLGLAAWLPAFGAIYVPCPADDLPNWPARAAEAGLLVYQYFQEEAPVYATPEALVVLVRAGYNPIAHAQHLTAEGHPEWAYDLLEAIPAVLQEDVENSVSIDFERLFVTYKILLQCAPPLPLSLYSRAQHYYHRIVERRPGCHPAHQIQADLWRLAGAPQLATRILDTLLESERDPGIQQQRDALQTPFVSERPQVPPSWAPAQVLPRILFLTHPRMHYGLDVLYDGLVQLLGPTQIMEYPHKPSLHGQVEDAYWYYPCAFTHPGKPIPLAEILAALRAGEFDLILYGDCEGSFSGLDLEALMAAAGKLPLYIVDALDEAWPIRAMVEARLGRAAEGYFKREMVHRVDYGPASYALPFAYPDKRIPSTTNTNRDLPLFWAGHRKCGFRRRFLEALEAHLGAPFTGEYAPEDYNAQLARAQVGLGLFGYGFDTVRYWEIPAHGAMLLSEALPLRIPHPFEEGVHAVHFTTTQELLERVDYYTAHPDEAARVAAAGHEHLLAHHTSKARARQLLGWIRSLGGPC